MSHSSASRAHTRPSASAAANSASRRSDARSRELNIASIASATDGRSRRNVLNADAEMTRSVTGSTAVTSAERGSSSTSACSPSSAPGPRNVSTASVPAVVGTVTFTRPDSSTSTRSAASPRASSTSGAIGLHAASDPAERLAVVGAEELQELGHPCHPRASLMPLERRLDRRVADVGLPINQWYLLPDRFVAMS